MADPAPSLFDSVSLSRLLGTDQAPGLISQLGSVGDKLGGATDQWKRLLGIDPSVAPTAPATPPRADGTLTAPAPAGVVQQLTSSKGLLVGGAIALVVLLVLYLKEG